MPSFSLIYKEVKILIISLRDAVLTVLHYSVQISAPRFCAF